MPTDRDDDRPPVSRDGMTPEVLEVVWHEDESVLVVDGETLYAQGDPPRVDVRVGVLRRLRASQLPDGLEVQAVRKVAGSHREMYPEGGCPIFWREATQGVLLVAEAVVVDEEDEPEPAARASRLQAELEHVLDRLADLQKGGRIESFEAGGVFPEDALAYWHCTLAVRDLDRPVYEIMTKTPDLASLPGQWSDPHPGLTLTCDTRLHRFDATAFDALIAQVLGPDTDVTIEERSNMNADGPAFIRINGSIPEDLVEVAEAFYDRAWRSAADADERALKRTMSALELLFGPRLDRMRDDPVKVEANTALLADEDVREAITDKAQDHVGSKRKREFSTRTQRLITAVASEVKKRTVDVLVGEGVADAMIAIGGEVVGDAMTLIEDARADRFERRPIAVEEGDGS